jgi:hypothetical protein
MEWVDSWWGTVLKFLFHLINSGMLTTYKTDVVLLDYPVEVR